MRHILRSGTATAVAEYDLLVALVDVLLIGVVTTFGSSIASWFAARTSVITTSRRGSALSMVIALLGTIGAVVGMYRNSSGDPRARAAVRQVLG